MKVSGSESAETQIREFSSDPVPYQRLTRVLSAVLWTIGIMIACWLPRDVVHKIERDGTFVPLPNFDKVVHWVIFVGFALLWLRALSGNWRKNGMIVAGLLLIVVTELVQELPAIGRDATIGDFVADALGLITGLLIERYVEPSVDRLESLILRRLFGNRRIV